MANDLVQITGFTELQSKIQQLANDKSKKREVISVLKQVAQPVVMTAKLNAPMAFRKHYGRNGVQAPGTLKRSIGIIVGKKGSARENPTIYVGPRTKGQFDGYFGNWVEYGHEIYNDANFSFTRSSNGRITSLVKRNRSRSQKKGSVSQGKTKENPFMQKTHNQTKGNMSAESAEKIARYIQRKIDKLSR